MSGGRFDETAQATHECRFAGTLRAINFNDATTRHAANPERVHDIGVMPPLKLVARNQAGDVRYTFADPYKCRCLYVGGAKEYSAYQRLVKEKQIEQEPPLDGEPTDGLWGPLDSQ